MTKDEEKFKAAEAALLETLNKILVKDWVVIRRRASEKLAKKICQDMVNGKDK